VDRTLLYVSEIVELPALSVDNAYRQQGSVEMRKVTIILLCLFVATLSFSLIRRQGSPFVSNAAQSQDSKAERANQAKRNFPVADISENDSDNSAKGLAKKEKRQRFDAWQMVPQKAEPWAAERVVSAQGYTDFPALPVDQSEIILIATVTSSEAHVSGNKKAVFSEFNIVVESVLKTTHDIKEGSLLTVNRIGGYVKYPNGQEILIRVNGVNMPQVGTRYLLFLSAKRNPDFIILTGYELGSQGVMALDFAEQYFSLEGISEAEIQKRVRDLLTK